MIGAMEFPAPGAVQLGGVLGHALTANHTGRLTHFITDETSPAIALFAPAHAQRNEQGDWYGEHAGKWLSAAAKAAQRTGDAQLSATVRRVADYLLSRQDADGYLGTYAPLHRFTRRQPAGRRTRDGAPGVRTWDIWTHSYLMLGMIEAGKCLGDPRYLECARRMGDLCWRTLTDGGIDITDLGNHHGMSATVLLEPAVELYFATREKGYLDLARRVLEQADNRAELRLLSGALAGTDAAEIGTGKAYQLGWNFVGIAKLYRATGDPELLKAVLRVWESIRRSHLTLGGGPWGGVAHRSREVFNHPGVFSPYGYVETCSTFAWLLLNRELLGITGEAKYAEEIERSAYNDLLGAQAPDGMDWCYYSFPNGRRVFTTYWRCCKSSGAMALEELPSIAYARVGDDIAVNLYGDGDARLATPQAGTVRLTQITRYPFDGDIRIVVAPERPAKFSIMLRIPTWVRSTMIRVNGVEAKAAAAAPAGYFWLERTWQKNDEIVLGFAMPPVLHTQLSRNVQESQGPDGEPISQEVMRYDYVAITRGPLVYATGLIDGFKIEETIRLPDSGAKSLLEDTDPPPGYQGPAIRMNVQGRPPLTFTPYYEAGGRKDGTWRLTWMQLAPKPHAPGVK